MGLPERLQPRQENLRFNLEAALQSVVQVHQRSRTSLYCLGARHRANGHGSVIGSDGSYSHRYLITEAESIWLTTNDGAVVPGPCARYDQVTGFGLVLPLDVSTPDHATRLQRHPQLSAKCDGDRPRRPRACPGCKIIARREFAATGNTFSMRRCLRLRSIRSGAGTALVGEDGKCWSWFALVQEAAGPETVDANMFCVPIDLLEPILEDMLKFGRPARAGRPWLGLYATPRRACWWFGDSTSGGPAQRAGVKLGDVLLEVAGEPVSDLAELFRKVWRVGPAGSEIAMTLARGATRRRCRVTSRTGKTSSRASQALSLQVTLQAVSNSSAKVVAGIVPCFMNSGETAWREPVAQLLLDTLAQS